MLTYRVIEFKTIEEGQEVSSFEIREVILLSTGEYFSYDEQPEEIPSGVTFKDLKEQWEAMSEALKHSPIVIDHRNRVAVES